MNKRGNISPDVEALGIEPLSARSIVLSALLGTHPPRLAGHQLSGLGELFGVRPGTVRTALSRMVASGELVTDEGGFGLGQRLLERQRQQDDGRVAPADPWDGLWFTAIVAVERRSVAQRRSFRATMAGARMAELRPDVWMRPANTTAPDRPDGVLVTHGALMSDGVDELVAQLWQLDDIDARARELIGYLEQHRPSLDDVDATRLPNAFVLSAAVVRFLREEPQLPVELQPQVWSPPALRVLYDEFEAALRTNLHHYWSSIGPTSS